MSYTKFCPNSANKLAFCMGRKPGKKAETVKKELFCVIFVVVVSPLIEYIRYQQVERLRKLELWSACLEESLQSNHEVVA